MPDLEAAKIRRLGEGGFAVLLNMTAQLALQDCLEKRVDFIVVARGLEFHPAVPEIPHEAGYVETFCDIPNRPAKTNALDIAFVKDLHRCAHASED